MKKKQKTKTVNQNFKSPWWNKMVFFKRIFNNVFLKIWLLYKVVYFGVSLNIMVLNELNLWIIFRVYCFPISAVRLTCCLNTHYGLAVTHWPQVQIYEEETIQLCLFAFGSAVCSCGDFHMAYMQEGHNHLGQGIWNLITY